MGSGQGDPSQTCQYPVTANLEIGDRVGMAGAVPGIFYEEEKRWQRRG